MILCPNCKTELRPKEKFCHHCGNKIELYPKKDIVPKKIIDEKKIQQEKPALGIREEKTWENIRKKDNKPVIQGKMERGWWLYIFLALSLEIAFVMWSLISPLSPADDAFIAFFIFSVFFGLLAIGILFKHAILDRRRDQHWTKNAKVKLALGVLVVVLFVIPGLRSWTYHNECVDRLGPGAILVGCDFIGMDLSGTDLHGSYLGGARLDNAILHQTNFSNADLSRAYLKDSDLSEAILRRANLDRARLNDADLSNAILEQATLTNADLHNANLSGTVLVGAVLDNCNLQNVIGLTDDYLAAVLDVSDGLLASRLSQKKIRLESRESIFKSLECVCHGTGVSECANYTADESFHPIILLNNVGDRHRWSDQIPEEWEPMAMRFCQLVVSIVKEDKILVETCSYLLGSSIERYQYQMQLRVFAAATGEVVAEHLIQGTPPEECPSSAPKYRTVIEGDHVSFSDLQLWLEENIVKIGT